FSTRATYLAGQGTIPSDTVCYPAKLAHGHVKELAEMPDIDAIFYPCMSYNFDEGLGDNHYNCRWWPITPRCWPQTAPSWRARRLSMILWARTTAGRSPKR